MDPEKMYSVARDGQILGPYTLTQVREYVTQGSVALTDLAWAQGMSAWSPVSDVLSSSSESAGHPPLPPQSLSHGVSTPRPPSLHWALVLLLGVVTFGIFILVWMFVQAAWARRINSQPKPLYILAITLPIYFAVAFFAELITATTGSPVGEIISTLGSLGWTIAVLVAYFDMRATIEVRYQVRLSGLMTFFFNVLYLQYHMTRIARNEHTPDTGQVLGI